MDDYMIVSSKNLYKLDEPLSNSLRGLWCYNNNLKILLELPNSLKSLYCSNNYLTILPKLPKLYWLYIDKTQIILLHKKYKSRNIKSLKFRS